MTKWTKEYRAEYMKKYFARKKEISDFIVKIDAELKDLESIVDKYLKPFAPKDTKEKDPKAQARSKKAKE